MRAALDTTRTAALAIGAALTLLLAGCTAAAAPAASAGLVTSERAVTTGQQGSAGSESVTFMDLVAPGLGLVGTSPSANGPGHARLVVSTDNGRSFTAIGPATEVATAPDDVFFRNREDGWFAVFNVDTTGEKLYRTTDGGRSWQAYWAPGHVLAAGSQDSVQFTSPTDGWLLSLQPTGPVESLSVTSDGGGHWQPVAALRPRHGPGVLPEIGLVRFGPDGTGWLGGWQFSDALYRSTDGGLKWQRMGIAAPAGSVFGLPSVFGQTVIEPVTSGTALRLYRSSDGGARWSLGSELAHASDSSGCGPGLISVSFPAPRVGWAAAVLAGRTEVYRTTDGGARWTAIATGWRDAPGSCGLPQVQAVSASQAWVLNTSDVRLYATGDGGTAWRRIDLTALAAAGRA